MFIETDLETLLPYFEKLEHGKQPLWGQMSAQRMVEHLTDTLLIATGENPWPSEVPEEKFARMTAFLDTDKPMAQGMTVSFAAASTGLRHEEIELAIDEYIEVWLNLEDMYTADPALANPHPYYGPLTFDQWKRLHSKHLTHHFKQFGLLE